MKMFLTLVVAVTMVISALVPLHQVSADEKKMSDAEMEMMKKWHEMATPGEAHKVLEHFIGDWDYTVKWWNAPGTEPEISTGDNESKWIMGGRFIESEAEGTSMGQKFEGMGIIGYDNVKKEYTSVWVDSMSPGMMTATGSYDAEKNQLIETGSYTDPMTGQEKSFRGVTTIIDKDNHTFEFYTEGPDGKEFRQMEITYKRQTQL